MGRIDAGRLGGMILIAGAISLVSGCAGPVSTPASPTESPIDGVMVTVTVHDVVDLEGGAVAGVLYTGAEMLEANAIGVFGAQVDSDPFRVGRSDVRLSIDGVPPRAHPGVAYADALRRRLSGVLLPGRRPSRRRVPYFTARVGGSSVRPQSSR